MFTLAEEIENKVLRLLNGPSKIEKVMELFGIRDFDLQQYLNNKTA